METDNTNPVNPEQPSAEDKPAKKAWRPLHLKVLDVPRMTKGGMFQLDPVEDFTLYRIS